MILMVLILFFVAVGLSLALFAGIQKTEEEQRKDDEAQMRYLKDWKNRKKK